MNHILVFAGTTEGRAITEFLAQLPVKCWASVTTEYGRALLPSSDRVHTLNRRMDAVEMQRFIQKKGIHLVIDATHPYATEASANIRKACAAAGVECLRLARESLPASPGAFCEYYRDIPSLVGRLNQLEGNILLTTGSKDLQAFTAVKDYRQRIYPRILPAITSLEVCRNLEYEMSHVICMQGPFTEELNMAMMRQLEIRILVTKASGQAGGFGEKATAAEKLGVSLLVLEPPVKEEGFTLSGLEQELLRRYGKGARGND